MPRLEVRDLVLVLSLGETRSTAAASQRLHLTQSAVSRALALAEERVGTKLFVRSARGVTPTDAGTRLIAGARAVLSQLKDLEQTTIAPPLPAARLRVVCECYTAYRWLPSALVELERRMPGFRLHVESNHTHEPLAALTAGKVDLALLTTSSLRSLRERAGLVERPLFEDEVVFLLSRSHPLAARRTLEPDDLVRHGVITGQAPEAEANWFARQVFGRRRPRVRTLRFPLTEAVVDAARAGLGVGLLSEWVASSYLENGDVVTRRLTRGPLMRPWRAAYRESQRPAVEALLERLKASARA